MKQILALTRKELGSYFGSPMALIFMGAFLAITLFSFFWVETFFAKGVANVRPLFNWMPLLMILLVSALTMRQWSEEQRSGTLEILLTLPVSHIKLVIGKFLAVLALVVLALALTIFLPITVSFLGDLDWGPVIGGYVAAVLLASSYAAIGLYISSKTDNQIVALISTMLLCGVFYMIGSSGVTDFMGEQISTVLKAIGTGSRFESIQRGVIDVRDLVYYLSISGLFLTLNVISLDKKRWSTGKTTLAHRQNMTLTSLLIALNLVVLNIWLTPLHGLRLDLTEDKEFSLSDTTRDLLSNLNEPLLIRGYFSERTHPLLAPLVPQIRDTLQEYEIASGDRIKLEIIDPTQYPELEAEANQVYGISPTPFQVSDRYQASIINSYFSILFRYGDQSVILGYNDLIELEQTRDGTLSVQLRNLEYDLTRTIKKVVQGFQSVDAVLAAMTETVELTIFLTPDTLPEWFVDVPETIQSVAEDIESKSDGKFVYTVINPDDPQSTMSRQELYEIYGIQPIAASLFSDQSYYLHMVLTVGDEALLFYPGGELTEADVRTSIESALKRMSTGFLKVVGLWQPPSQPTQDIFGQTQEPLSSWNAISSQLSQEYEVRTVDLNSGEVPANIDVLVLIGPQGFTDKELFAIDQYLMRGGSVVAAAGNYGLTADPYTGGLGLLPLSDGIQPLLEHYGITVGDSLVMDPQNEPFPVPVTREIEGFQIQQIEFIDYPFFVDVRSDAMDNESPIVTGLPAVTVNWASPITIDEETDEAREVVFLLQSSAGSWLRTDTNIQPDFELFPSLGFGRSGEPQSYTLAVSVQGSFESYFIDHPSPFDQPLEEEETAEIPEEPERGPAAGTIEVSPETSRLVVIGSTEFVDDVVFNISSSLAGERYRNTLQLIQNAVDWCVEDLELLSIRARGTHVRLLKSLESSDQSFLEGLNYLLALLALVVIGVVWNLRRRDEKPMEMIPQEQIAKPGADTSNRAGGE